MHCLYRLFAKFREIYLVRVAFSKADNVASGSAHISIRSILYTRQYSFQGTKYFNVLRLIFKVLHMFVYFQLQEQRNERIDMFFDRIFAS